MIWVGWRQHRSEALTCLGLLIVLFALGAVVTSAMRGAFTSDGLSCVAGNAVSTSCQQGVGSFMHKFSGPVNIGFWALMLFIPGLIGVLIGAPLLGRELETGTWRLAWSQTVPRTRWLVVMVSLTGGGLIVLGALMTLIITWFRAPMDKLTGHFVTQAFDYEGLVLTSYILAAFGLAVLTGLLLRRSIPAMVAAFVPWLGIRIVAETLLRPAYLAPVTLVEPCGPPAGCSINQGITTVPPQTGHVGDWVLNIIPRAGQIIVRYQPASRFWTFQFIEAGIFVAIALAALALAAWLLYRRAA
jgi:hypothetical protein